ncbi:MAG: hypothetical protein FAZ92_03038 [Accumulibacter sp.]|uniref:DUF2092 domain-containing protein n=1 Tax=Accumulibacter sp. TaxID=2053492 RepID=UPI0012270FF5|nr:DUF2092 domain-containing protein [Accumulibacter sp.]TLD44681.1 MAG: hypothetical protein FAZ92_03038 [Accumulibacter sp.]
MKQGLLASLLLAIALAPPLARAQAAAPPPSTSSTAVDPAAIQALKDMGAYLQGLSRFRVSTELTGERVLADGQKLQHTASAVIDVARPNRLRARMSSARSVRELFYDGRQATLYSPAQKYYSTVEFSGSLAELVDRLEQRYGVEVPLADLFLWGTAAAPADGIESAMNAGQDFIGGDLCDHFALRQGKLDWQIWIEAGGKPLPRKLVITNRADEARPQSVSLIEWQLKPGFPDSIFTFVPSKGSKSVELRALDRN